jgi:hypothetical protein
MSSKSAELADDTLRLAGNMTQYINTHIYVVDT